MRKRCLTMGEANTGTRPQTIPQNKVDKEVVLVSGIAPTKGDLLIDQGDQPIDWRWARDGCNGPGSRARTLDLRRVVGNRPPSPFGTGASATKRRSSARRGA